MLKIAICDDSVQQLQTIRCATQLYFNTHEERGIHVEALSSPFLCLEQMEKNGGYDIVLLDICMPGISGTQIAKEIRRRQDKTEIIFLTTSDEYAVDAFALKAAHYLIKPVSQSQFDEAMDRAMSRLLLEPSKRVVLKAESGELHNLEISDILLHRKPRPCAYGSHQNAGFFGETTLHRAVYGRAGGARSPAVYRSL